MFCGVSLSKNMPWSELYIVLPGLFFVMLCLVGLNVIKTEGFNIHVEDKYYLLNQLQILSFFNRKVDKFWKNFRLFIKFYDFYKTFEQRKL